VAGVRQPAGAASVAGVAPELSVCIPTHEGRAETLEYAVRSVARQVAADRTLAGRVDVCVSDGGSRDGTAARLEALRAEFGDTVRYRRHERDAGFAWHLLDSLDLAEGCWCWIMSSDDAVAPGALRRVLEVMGDDRALTGLSVGLDVRDIRMEPVSRDPYGFVYPPDRNRPRTYTNREAVLAELGPLLAYLAAHVVDRERWAAAVAAERAGGGPASRYFPHIEVIARMLDLHPRWGWCPEPLVVNRAGNDSWTARAFGGDVSRYWKAILGDLDGIWCRYATPAVRRANARAWLTVLGGGEQLRAIRVAPGASRRRDARLALALGRIGWRDSRYWTVAVPTFLTPRSRLRRRVTANDGAVVGG
jgi:glycosyltransferase involved in cell wall biosynthesis